MDVDKHTEFEKKLVEFLTEEGFDVTSINGDFRTREISYAVFFKKEGMP